MPYTYPTGNINAGIVLKSRFVQSSTEEFANYVNYMDRNEATRNEHFSDYSLYNDYMDNPEKTSALFTADRDRLSEKQKSDLKNIFKQAQKNDSLMWQNVISFDTRWLIQYGIHNTVIGETDEAKLRAATRRAMSTMMNKENLSSSLLWSASIHYDKEHHIHIHIAAVEPISTRSRGKLKLSTFNSMKAKTLNSIIDRSAEHTEITNIMRKSLKDNNEYNNVRNDRILTGIYNDILIQLPEDKRMWRYNMNAISHLRPDIDKLTNLYIYTYHKDEYKKFLKLLEKESNLQREAFGDSKSVPAEAFEKNKIKDLYAQMGNTILRSMLKHDKEESNYICKTAMVGKNIEISEHSPDSTLYILKKLLKKDWESIKNQLAYGKLMDEIELDNETGK